MTQERPSAVPLTHHPGPRASTEPEVYLSTFDCFYLSLVFSIKAIGGHDSADSPLKALISDILSTKKNHKFIKCKALVFNMLVQINMEMLTQSCVSEQHPA